MSDRRVRRHSWNRSSSEGFGPIRQVGIAYSIGFPMMVVGVLLLAIASSSEGSTFLWILAGGLFAGGLVAAASGRIT
jgi:hypothetical protein